MAQAAGPAVSAPESLVDCPSVRARPRAVPWAPAGHRALVVDLPRLPARKDGPPGAGITAASSQRSTFPAHHCALHVSCDTLPDTTS
ncbi:hypothetical protein GCM10009696_29770 [Kocuria himachalensis]